MDIQKKRFNKIFIISFVILSTVLLFSIFVTKKQTTYATADKLIIELGGYTENTWSQQDVTVSATAKPEVVSPEIFYGINPQKDEDFVEYKGEFIVTDEGEPFKNENGIQFKIIYKNGEQTFTDYSEIIKINIDKKKPVVEKIEISETDFTQNSVSIKIFLADSSIYQEDYRAKFFNIEYKPLTEYLSKGMIVFEYITEENITFEADVDIVIIDQANNQTPLDEKIVINNIERTIPDFKISLLNGKHQGEKYIEINLGHIHSQAKEIVLEYPSGETENLEIKQKQKIKINENGTYIIKVVSNAGNDYSQGINVNNIKSMQIYGVLFVILFVVSISVGIFVARLKHIKK